MRQHTFTHPLTHLHMHLHIHWHTLNTFTCTHQMCVHRHPHSHVCAHAHTQPYVHIHSHVFRHSYLHTSNIDSHLHTIHTHLYTHSRIYTFYTRPHMSTPKHLYRYYSQFYFISSVLLACLETGIAKPYIKNLEWYNKQIVRLSTWNCQKFDHFSIKITILYIAH